jgi:hypothetical protein
MGSSMKFYYDGVSINKLGVFRLSNVPGNLKKVMVAGASLISMVVGAKADDEQCGGPTEEYCFDLGLVSHVKISQLVNLNASDCFGSHASIIQRLDAGECEANPGDCSGYEFTVPVPNDLKILKINRFRVLQEFGSDEVYLCTASNAIFTSGSTFLSKNCLEILFYESSAACIDEAADRALINIIALVCILAASAIIIWKLVYAVQSKWEARQARRNLEAPMLNPAEQTVAREGGDVELTALNPVEPSSKAYPSGSKKTLKNRMDWIEQWADHLEIPDIFARVEEAGAALAGPEEDNPFICIFSKTLMSEPYRDPLDRWVDISSIIEWKNAKHNATWLGLPDTPIPSQQSLYPNPARSAMIRVEVDKLGKLLQEYITLPKERRGGWDEFSRSHASSVGSMHVEGGVGVAAEGRAHGALAGQSFLSDKANAAPGEASLQYYSFGSMKR